MWVGVKNKWEGENPCANYVSILHFKCASGLSLGVTITAKIEDLHTLKMIKLNLKTLRKLSGFGPGSETFIPGAFRITLESLGYPLGVHWSLTCDTVPKTLSWIQIGTNG